MDLIEFESSSLENASIMLEVCREEYARAGFDREALQLKGLEVTGRETARVALLTLHGFPYCNSDTEEARRYAMAALKQAFANCRKAV